MDDIDGYVQNDGVELLSGGRCSIRSFIRYERGGGTMIARLRKYLLYHTCGGLLS